MEVAVGLGGCEECRWVLLWHPIPSAPPVSCSSISQTHSSSFPTLANTLFPSSVFCEGIMLKAASIPLPHLLPVHLRLIYRWTLFAILKTWERMHLFLLFKTCVILTLYLRDRIHFYPFWLFASCKVTFMSAGILQRNQTYTLTAVNLLKKLRNTVTFFSGMHTPSTL